MQKSASAYKTISEVSEMLDIPAHVLRFWESKFSQLKPMKRSGGRRYYRLEDIALLETIKSLLYDEGYTIKGAQASLSKRRKADAVPASPEAAGQGPAALAPSVPVSLP
ncbi:MAG: MerR family transcriptional regulator, partial [Candidatus Puniceispirillaceae bacterium]